ncbi:hypothetical protein AS156_18805 [Bradyrhizobium macuxiense]|uniref:Uncharacterized protein n=1 Tax=Bradyrhizobium macuxiense TaxID=1755647 RepID=A0A109JGF2_9BRAD|nr:hypothetical protein AS156_18805 [Bradyrhizobium macuxiense]
MASPSPDDILGHSYSYRISKRHALAAIRVVEMLVAASATMVRVKGVLLLWLMGRIRIIILVMMPVTRFV